MPHEKASVEIIDSVILLFCVEFWWDVGEDCYESARAWGAVLPYHLLGLMSRWHFGIDMIEERGKKCHLHIDLLT
jgi:hypothetical protein